MVWRYFTCGVNDPVSSGDFSPAFGDDEIISKNNDTINNPAIAAPINIYPLVSFSLLPAILSARDLPRFNLRFPVAILIGPVQFFSRAPLVQSRPCPTEPTAKPGVTMPL